MKSAMIVMAALTAATLVVLGLGYLGYQYWPYFAAQFGPTIAVDSAARAHAAERKLRVAKDAYARWVALGDAALWKSTQPNTDEAARLAAEMLLLAEHYKTDWNDGNAIHKANSALGRIALRNGDLTLARRYLLASTDSMGSPQMNLFGPNMSFADEMLKAGEKEAVLSYLRRCRRFWEMGHNHLDAWESLIRKDIHPAFGANLLY